MALAITVPQTYAQAIDAAHIDVAVAGTRGGRALALTCRRPAAWRRLWERSPFPCGITLGSLLNKTDSAGDNPFWSLLAAPSSCGTSPPSVAHGLDYVARGTSGEQAV